MVLVRRTMDDSPNSPNFPPSQTYPLYSMGFSFIVRNTQCMAFVSCVAMGKSLSGICVLCCDRNHNHVLVQNMFIEFIPSCILGLQFIYTSMCIRTRFGMYITDMYTCSYKLLCKHLVCTQVLCTTLNF